jgi:hypothetical protein
MKRAKLLLLVVLAGAGLLVGWDELVTNFLGKPLTTPASYTNGYVWKYSTSTGKYVLSADTGGAETIRLEELSDVATMTEAAGDLLQRNAGNTAWDRLGIGAADTFLASTGTAAAYRLIVATDIDELLSISDLTDVSPMTEANGDILIYNSGWTRLAKGSDGQVLTLASGLPSWAAGGAGSSWEIAEDATSVDADVTTLIVNAEQLNATQLASGVVFLDFVTGGVTNTALGADSVTSAKIANDEIVNADINSAAGIAYSKLAFSNNIVAGDIATGAVATAEILDGTVTGGAAGAGVDIAADTITADNIATNGVGAAEIAASAVGTSEVDDNTLTASDLAANSVEASELADNAVDTNAVANDAVTFAKIQTITDARLVGRSAGSDGDLMHITVGGTAGGLTLSGGALNANGQTLFVGVTGGQAAGITNYLGSGAAQTEAQATIPWPQAGTIDKLYCHVSPAPGGAETFIFTFRKNAADQAVTATITGAATTANDTSNSFTVATGDLIAVKCVSSGGAATAFIKVGFRFRPD